jgi:hypothetical protein
MHTKTLIGKPEGKRLLPNLGYRNGCYGNKA